MSSERLAYQQIARMIDISAVQAPHGAAEIEELLRAVQEYGFGAVHVLPAWVTFTRALLPAGSAALGAPVGFPSGGTHSAIKRAEALQLVADGVDEMDMMLNVGKLRSGEDAYVLAELHSVIEAVPVPVKVILETHYLTQAEIERAVQMCLKAGAAFVKTSTGWAPTGATLKHIKIIADVVAGRIGIKAAGGIRDLETLLKMYRLGVRRFGINLQAAVAIVQACRALPAGEVEINA